MQGLVTVFGGSGFLGRYVVRALAKQGWRIRVAMRRPHLAPELRVMGDVGQVELIQANLRYPDSVARVVEGSQACVNLVGVLYQAGRQGFQALHVDGARILAQQSRAAGAQRFIQISAIAADPASPSQYGRTKAEGEGAVGEAFPGATILRPSIVFGPEDDFFNRFAGMAVSSPMLPLIGGGATRLQPVYAGDVGAAVAACLADPATAGRTYELGGPGVYTFRQLMEMMLRETHRRRMLVPIPMPAARAMGRFGDLQTAILPFIPPQITLDQVLMLGRDNVADPSAAGLQALGVTPTPLEGVLPQYLWKYRRGGQFAPPETTRD
ncbi:MAG: complex I NDUFA9 subunit family protein [Caulobacteraceae bacterium]